MEKSLYSILPSKRLRRLQRRTSQGQRLRYCSITAKTCYTQKRKESENGKDLSVATHATDDQTKSTAAFVTVIGAIGAGKEATIVLIGEAAYLAKEEIAKSVHGVGFPPLPELIEQVVEGDVAVYVLGACSVARGVTEDDLETLNASFFDPIKFANLVAESNVVSF